jgi:3-deoxy-manno-octulosonate cytidylyltransferase (CMP-KDO synthetase)
MKTIILIPARLAAQRLPDKPLADIGGKAMIVQVLERALAADIARVVVACCSESIRDVVRAAGGEAVLTDPALASGTDRIHAALQAIDPDQQYDSVINLQGDLPFIHPQQIRDVLKPFATAAVNIATLAAPFADSDDVTNPNQVKIALAQESATLARALYFSRSPIPHQASIYYHHIGIYAFRRQALEAFVKLAPSPLERQERLEQLRAMEAGMRIDVCLTTTIPQSVDTLEDLEAVRNQACR